jgi:1,4-dihydroxy-2-naphthoate octaprenyltransferase
MVWDMMRDIEADITNNRKTYVEMGRRNEKTEENCIIIKRQHVNIYVFS